MLSGKSEAESCQGHGRKNMAVEIANTLEWLVTAFILAFVFRICNGSIQNPDRQYG